MVYCVVDLFLNFIVTYIFSTTKKRIALRKWYIFHTLLISSLLPTRTFFNELLLTQTEFIVVVVVVVVAAAVLFCASTSAE